LLVLGCLGNGNDPKVPGEALGGYHVVGRLQQSTCGPGALGSTDVWEFDVRLSRDDRDLYWLNGREAILGQIAADGISFIFDTRVAIHLGEARAGRAGCSLSRVDQASGTLSSADLEVLEFSGQLHFGYIADRDADCSDIVGVAGGLATLPCEIRYAIAASRTVRPDDLE
jgi:hypothetical protein